MNNVLPRRRLLLLGLAGFSLLFGLWAGLFRMGWDWPILQPSLPKNHGPLMISGFLGTLIMLERAVAIRKGWTYLGVVMSGLGGFLLILEAPNLWGSILLTLGSLWLCFIFLFILRQHPAFYTAAMACGAICWLIGCILWILNMPMYQVVLWWAAFLLLTIAGERLELSAIGRLNKIANRLFFLACILLIVSMVLRFIWLDLGWRLYCLSLFTLAIWLYRFDIARRTVHRQGLPRYIATCLIAGYAWLGVAGITGIFLGLQGAGFYYDMFLHAIFVGFVISMIFGHAPIILPAILNLELAYSPVFYLPLALLHSSLLLRLIGDLMGRFNLRLWGGLFNALSILLFLGLILNSQLFKKVKKPNRETINNT